MVIGLGVFGFTIALSGALTLFWGWRYWRVDSDGIANGNLFRERKLAFAEIEFVEIKNAVFGARPFMYVQEELCFYKGKAMVMIPTFCLSEAEKEWLKQLIDHHN